MSRLIMMMKNCPLKQIALRGKRLSIGRGEDNGLTIDSPEISREHAEIVVARGTVTIRDLHSTNGTFVNGRKIVQQRLNHGDVVRVGNCDLRYLCRNVVPFRASQMALAS